MDRATNIKLIEDVDLAWKPKDRGIWQFWFDCQAVTVFCAIFAPIVLTSIVVLLLVG